MAFKTAFLILFSAVILFYIHIERFEITAMRGKRKSSSFCAARIRRDKKLCARQSVDPPVIPDNPTARHSCPTTSDLAKPCCSSSQAPTSLLETHMDSTSTVTTHDNAAFLIPDIDQFTYIVGVYGLDQSLSEHSEEEDELPQIYRQLLKGDPKPVGRPQNGSKYKLHSFDRIHAGPLCEFCGAYRFKMESKGICCLNGKLASVPLPPDPPAPIADLNRNRSFLNDIRSYNNVLALASIGCEEVRAGGFSPVVKVHGKIHHYVGPLTPNAENRPCYAQLYFCDTVNELANRCALREGIDPDIVRAIQDCLHEVNPHVKAIKYASSRVIDAPSLQVVLRSDGSKMMESPTEDAVAGLINEQSDSHLNVVLETQSGDLKRINEMNHLYDPLHYVVLFPHGGNGYHLGIVDSLKKSVSASKYCRYLIQVRKPDISGNYLVRSRRLFQQYVIDQFAKQESYRMAWYRLHQRELRAEKYSGLVDAASHNDSNEPGKRIILPPSHYGSPRWYAEVFQDSMSIVRVYGKPDLFITMTCNPKWPEITESLNEGETSLDRPDIVSRVFNLKHERMIKVLTKDKLFGKVTAFISMKEDQKRGLPHAHVLVTLDKDSKPRTPEDVDKIISAEIPDKNVYPELHSCITTHNIHGPCGEIRNDARCMKKDKAGQCCCMKWFPKAFNNGETEFIENGYPRYKRRDSLHGGFVTYRTVNGKVYTIDNRWVVPYNRVLSEMFNCHMNVEVVSTVGAVKYICLYLTKGTDKTLYSLLTEAHNGIIDEIRNFSVARYISSQEALWRLFEFDILKKYPPVEKLAIHLPDQQTVVFDPNNLDHVLSDGPPVTSLTAYFQLNTEDPEARAFTYTEICRYYRFVRKNWVKRQRNICSGKPGGPLSDTIGRMPVINFTPKQAELYYLRLLLHHIPGPKSFNDLQIVNNVQLGTYREACLALGLITDDTECDQAIDEAASVRFGPNLRELFSTLLVYGELSDPAKLWDSHKDQLVEDIAHRNGRTGSPNDSDYNDALINIQRHLNVFELSLSADFGIHCIEGISTMVPEIQAFDEQFLADLSEANLSKMTHDQIRIYNQVMESIDSGNGTCFVLNAAGGTGKTFIHLIQSFCIQIDNPKKQDRKNDL